MKQRLYAVFMALLLTVTVTAANATGVIDDKKPVKENVANMTDEQKEARLVEIRNRVNEIKAMDRSTLSRAERKSLRKELKEMRKEAKTMSGGIYLSVGAIIIIILVLILIL